MIYFPIQKRYDWPPSVIFFYNCLIFTRNEQETFPHKIKKNHPSPQQQLERVWAKANKTKTNKKPVLWDQNHIYSPTHGLCFLFLALFLTDWTDYASVTGIPKQPPSYTVGITWLPHVSALQTYRIYYSMVDGGIVQGIQINMHQLLVVHGPFSKTLHWKVATTA